MENKETILTELRQLSEVVANLPKGNTYAVPPFYFEHLAAAILQRVNALQGIESVDKTVPFGVPDGYFDGLAANILQRVKQQEQSVTEELNELAPLLNTISKKPVYRVPQGYFESLEITAPLRVKDTGRVVSMSKPRRLLQYAVAACTAGILMVGAYLYTSNNGNNSDNGNGLAAIPYDSALQMNVKEALANVNEKEIDQYLTETPSTGYAINAVLTSPEEIDVEQNINSASDEELKQYLEENAGSREKGGS